MTGIRLFLFVFFVILLIFELYLMQKPPRH